MNAATRGVVVLTLASATGLELASSQRAARAQEVDAAGTVSVPVKTLVDVQTKAIAASASAQVAVASASAAAAQASARTAASAAEDAKADVAALRAGKLIDILASLAK